MVRALPRRRRCPAIAVDPSSVDCSSPRVAPPGLTLGVLVVALTLMAGACGVVTDGSLGAPGPGTTDGAPTATTTTAPPLTTPSSPVPTTVTTIVASPVTPPPVEPVPATTEAVQARLTALGYLVTDEPGVAGAGTAHAVMAFQKLNGLPRDGVAGPETLAALAVAGPVVPREGTDPHLEVDLAAQVVVVVAPDGTVTALDATTGKASTPTPPGRYSVFRQVDAWDPGPYGALYRPKYFNRGIAFHGGVPVLAAPASHGCVRLPDAAVDWLWSSGVAERGTPVVVA